MKAKAINNYLTTEFIADLKLKIYAKRSILSIFAGGTPIEEFDLQGTGRHYRGGCPVVLVVLHGGIGLGCRDFADQLQRHQALLYILTLKRDSIADGRGSGPLRLFRL